jgi:glutamate racemase
MSREAESRVRRSASAPLGVFDSGVGGLTVVRALRAACPSEDIVYLGDTARVPYGTRSPETVVRYAIGCSKVLVARGVKAIVVACNTVSAVALEMLRVELDLPILGVIEPGARAAVAALEGRSVLGVLGTRGTIGSGAYPRAVGAITTRVEVVGQPAPLLVPMAEEGWTDGDVPRLVATRYLAPVIARGARCIVLGCTHFPLFEDVLREEARKLAGEEVAIVDSARATAAEVTAFLEERGLARTAGPRGKLDVLATDLPATFREMAARFVGEELAHVEQVDL